MNKLTANYGFQEINRKFQFQPETPNQVKHQEHFEKAAEAAQDLKSEVQDIYLHLLSLDQTEHDLSKQPGEVMVLNQDYRGGKLSGVASAPPEPGQSTHVMSVRLQGDDGKALMTYDHHPGQNYHRIERVVDSGTESEVSESVVSGWYLREGVNEYIVTAGPQADSKFGALAQLPL